ncbi:MAG TPA: hypothetical protein VEZ90_12350, partial [Blastocatellia bacterium]|nr:hypothetical protein [Blastocatellia bacterium]
MRLVVGKRLRTTAIAIAASVGINGGTVATLSVSANGFDSANTTRAASIRTVGASAATRPAIRYGQLPVTFEPNEGQVDSKVKFIARTAGGRAFITADQAIIAMQARKTETRNANLGEAGHQTVVNSGSIAMKLEGRNLTPKVEGLDRAPGTINYFIGNDPKNWHTNIPTFTIVKESGVYPGIDLVYHPADSNPGQLEYDFFVAPRANPARIAISYNGATDMHLERGDLILKTSAGELRQAAPIAYQEVGGVRKTVACKFEIRGKYRRTASFRLGAYDH